MARLRKSRRNTTQRRQGSVEWYPIKSPPTLPPAVGAKAAYRVTAPHPVTGKPIRDKGIGTVEDADKHRVDHYYRVQGGHATGQDRRTLDRWFAEFNTPGFRVARGRYKAPSAATRDRGAADWRRYISPTLGQMAATEIRTAHVKHWQAEMTTRRKERGDGMLGIDTLANCYDLLSMTFDHMRQMLPAEIAFTHPMTGLTRPVVAKRQRARQYRDAPTLDQMRAMAAAFVGTPYWLLIVVGALTGFRLAELCGLRRCDWHAQTASFEMLWTRRSVPCTDNFPDGIYARDGGKSDLAHRELAVRRDDADLAPLYALFGIPASVGMDDLLRRHYADVNAWRVAASPDKRWINDDQAWLFVDEEGEPVTPVNVSNLIGRAWRKIGFKGKAAHEGFRAFHISYLANDRGRPDRAKLRAGHADMATTELYIKPVKRIEGGAIDAPTPIPASVIT
jgi:integrase